MPGVEKKRPLAENQPRGKPKVGVPWRTFAEETTCKAQKMAPYLRAVEAAGGEAVLLSLETPRETLAEVARTLDAILLPGSPADVDPAWYHGERHPRTAAPDPRREQTDFALLDIAFAEGKPVLAICYGLQSLNVYRGGTLVQDIASELTGTFDHDWRERQTTPEPFHAASLEAGSRLAQLAGTAEVRVNSHHHQCIQRPGRDLRVVARAPDGVIEAVELAEKAHWVTGVQWHPETLTDDALAASLFRALVASAHRVTAKP